MADHAAHAHHHHHHAVPATGMNRAFVLGIAFNLLFVVIEVVSGLMVHSLSLLADAGHNLADVGALALSLFAFRLMRVKPNEQFTYGYRKTSILVALFNAMILILSIGAILYEAIHRFFNPEIIPGGVIAWVAAAGIVVNGITALLFFRDKNKDINIKSAYLHLLSDALVSLVLVGGGILIRFTSWYWIDGVLSIFVSAVILYGTYGLLRESLRLSLDGVPENMQISALREEALRVPGVKGFHHIHVWAISSAENALTAHLVLGNETDIQAENHIKHQIRHLLEHHNIHHITLETEREQDDCETVNC